MASTSAFPLAFSSSLSASVICTGVGNSVRSSFAYRAWLPHASSSNVMNKQTCTSSVLPTILHFSKKPNSGSFTKTPRLATFVRKEKERKPERPAPKENYFIKVIPFPQKTRTLPAPKAAFPSPPAGQAHFPLPRTEIPDKARNFEKKGIGTIRSGSFGEKGASPGNFSSPSVHQYAGMRSTASVRRNSPFSIHALSVSAISREITWLVRGTVGILRPWISTSPESRSEKRTC